MATVEETTWIRKRLDSGEQVIENTNSLPNSEINQIIRELGKAGCKSVIPFSAGKDPSDPYREELFRVQVPEDQFTSRFPDVPISTIVIGGVGGRGQ